MIIFAFDLYQNSTPGSLPDRTADACQVRHAAGRGRRRRDRRVQVRARHDVPRQRRRGEIECGPNYLSLNLSLGLLFHTLSDHK